MNIGSLFMQLLAQSGTLAPSVEKEAQIAGEAGAKTLNQSLASGLKTRGVAAFGLAASAAFGIATKGALEFENVTADIQAETGLTADQAKHVASVVNQAAGENKMSLESVSAAAIKVHNDLGLTGDAADAMTKRFAVFARVTHQDAAGAVTNFDDILDTWGLTANDAIGIQDKLIVSNEKYGGSIQENQGALSRLAPQLKALGVDMDGAIGLLNLANATGLDTGRMMQALNTAVRKLKPGQTLDDLIKQISSIEDPTKRAQEAIRVFGARGGTALANALHPGINGLKEFEISEEEAADKTNKVADIIDSTFSGRISKAVSIAGAQIRQFGADFGPALTASASIASLLQSSGLFRALGLDIGGMIAKGIGGSKAYAGELANAVKLSAESGAVGSAMDKAGGFMGTKMGKAFGVAFAAVAVAEAINTYFQVKNQLDSQSAALAVQAQDFAQTATREQTEAALATAKDQYNQLILIRAGMSALPGIGTIANSTTDESVKNLEAVISTLETHLKAGGNAIGADTGSAVADGMTSAGPEIVQATAGIRNSVTNGLEQTATKAKVAGAKIPENFAQGVLSRQGMVLDAFNELKNLMQNALGRQGRIARNIGILTSKELAAGLHDRRHAVRIEAGLVQADAEKELARLVLQGGRVGKHAMGELKKALHDKNPDVRAAAQRTAAIVDAALHPIVPAAAQVGTDAGSALVANLRNSVTSGFENIGNAILPPTKRKKKKHRAMGGPTTAGEAYWINEHTANSELMVPGAGYVLTHADAVRALAGGGRGGDTFNIPVHVTGVLKAETPADIARPMRELASTGVIRSRRARSRVEVPTRA